MTTGDTKTAQLLQHLLPWLKQEAGECPANKFRFIFLDDGGKKRKNYPSFRDLKTHVNNDKNTLWLQGSPETANFIALTQTASRSARLGVLSAWALRGAWVRAR